MKWMNLIGVCSIVVAMMLAGGCGGDNGNGNGSEPAGTRAPEAEETETILGTMDEYRDEAAEEITAENAESELQKIQKEIESDIEAGD